MLNPVVILRSVGKLRHDHQFQYWGKYDLANFPGFYHIKLYKYEKMKGKAYPKQIKRTNIRPCPEKGDKK